MYILNNIQLINNNMKYEHLDYPKDNKEYTTNAKDIIGFILGLAIILAMYIIVV